MVASHNDDVSSVITGSSVNNESGMTLEEC